MKHRKARESSQQQLLVLVISVLYLVSPPALSAQAAAPVTVPQLIELLVEGVPQARILTIAAQASCVEGGSQEAFLAALRAAGGSTELLRVVERFACLEPTTAQETSREPPPVAPPAQGPPLPVEDVVGLLRAGVSPDLILTVMAGSCIEEGALPSAQALLVSANATPEIRRAAAVFQCATVEASPGSIPAPVSPLGVGFGDDQFSPVRPGSFQMGSAQGADTERPMGRVEITTAFSMQRTEVTQGQWQEIMGSNPSSFRACGDTCPVEGVSWEDIQQFLLLLNRRFPGRNYRLPTEAEWEYAARAGTTGDYGGTGVLEQMGWYSGNSSARTHPVGEKRPNAWGLHDMHGNVWEWVQDWYSEEYYRARPAMDPQGPFTGSRRVVRGGGWINDADFSRSAFRGGFPPSTRTNSFGFRLVRNP